MVTATIEKYVDFITELINELPAGVPIFTTDIVNQVIQKFGIEHKQAKGIVNTNLNRLNGKLIEHFRKGIYYKPKVTAFGKSALNPDQVVRKMFLKPKDNEVVGYETGASLLHQLGITTQMPKYRFIATNVVNHKGKQVIEELKVVLRKPHLPITADNYLYLQVLDVLENKDRVVFDAVQPDELINKFIVNHQLDYGKLLGMAMHYTKEVVLRLGKVAEHTRV